MAYAKPIKNKYINVTTSRVYTSCNTIPLTSTGIDMVLFTWQRKACERFANFLGWLKVKKQIPWFSFLHFIVVMQNVVHDCLYFIKSLWSCKMYSRTVYIFACHCGDAKCIAWHFCIFACHCGHAKFIAWLFCIFAWHCGHAKCIAWMFVFLHVIVVMQNSLQDCLNFCMSLWSCKMYCMTVWIFCMSLWSCKMYCMTVCIFCMSLWSCKIYCMTVGIFARSSSFSMNAAKHSFLLLFLCLVSCLKYMKVYSTLLVGVLCWVVLFSIRWWR